MTIPLVALQTKTGNALGSYAQGRGDALGLQRTQIQNQSAQQDVVRNAMDMFGSVALGAMGGKLDGQVDPQRYEQGLDWLASQGMDVSQLKGKPDLAPVLARGSLGVLQAINMNKGDEELQLRLKQFDMQMEQAAQNMEFARRREDREQQKHDFDMQNEGTGGYTAPIQAVDNEGNPVYIQTNDRGGVRKLKDYTPNNPIKTIDRGTEILTVDSRTGTVMARTPKDNRQAKFDEALGAQEGKNQAIAQDEFAELDTKMAGLREVVGQLYTLSDAATYTKAGQAYDEVRKQLGYEPTAGALARTKYMAMVDNQVLPLLKQTFGAAFTVQEGESLRATLGDPDKSPAEKKAVLDAFIAQKERDLRAMGARAFSVQPGPTQAKGISQSDYDSLPSGTVFEHNGKKYRKP